MLLASTLVLRVLLMTDTGSGLPVRESMFVAVVVCMYTHTSLRGPCLSTVCMYVDAPGDCITQALLPSIAFFTV
jgi:hypothetical protein